MDLPEPERPPPGDRARRPRPQAVPLPPGAGARSATPRSSTGWSRSARPCRRCASASSAISTCAACRARRCSRPCCTCIDATLMRVGNDEYARLNSSFGASTMRNEHAEVRGGQGADRVPRQARPRRRRPRRRPPAGADRPALPGPARRGAVRLPRRARRRAGRPVGGRERLPPRAGRPGLHRQGLPHVGRERARSRAARARSARATTEAETTRRQNTAIRVVAHDLGNTPAVCRSSYIHPAVLDAFRAGTLETTRLEAPAAIDGLRETEAYLLDLLGARLPPADRQRSQSASSVAQLLHADPPLDAARDPGAVHDHDGRRLRHAEALREVGLLVDVDLAAAERLVVPAGLQHLVDERLHPARGPGRRRPEEDQDRPRIGDQLAGHGMVCPPCLRQNDVCNEG